jgi:hypothetical protein
MTNSSEFPVGGYDIVELADAMFRGDTLGGLLYGNTTLTTTEPGFTDVVDPDASVAAEANTAYWPGGSPITGKHFMTIAGETPGVPSTNTYFAQQTTDIRNALVHASITKEAIGRIPALQRAGWENLRNRGVVPLLFAEELCAVRGLPLALIQTSRILQGGAAEARIMHMWYPAAVLSPKPVLAKVKNFVKGMIENETI